MPNDKTYFVYDPFYDHGRNSALLDRTFHYSDNPFEKDRLTLETGVGSVFPFYSGYVGMFAIEIPASTKTNNNTELQYFGIDMRRRVVEHISKEYAKSLIKLYDDLPYTIEPTTNLTNGEAWLGRTTVVIGLPIPPKDISHSTISNLI